MSGGGKRFERRLRALGYPQYASFDPSCMPAPAHFCVVCMRIPSRRPLVAGGDTVALKEVQAVVVFLEDMKVRHLKVEDRKPLRLFDAQWPPRFAHVPRQPTTTTTHYCHSLAVPTWCVQSAHDTVPHRVLCRVCARTMRAVPGRAGVDRQRGCGRQRGGHRLVGALRAQPRLRRPRYVA
jgi:hypothetical protein